MASQQPPLSATYTSPTNAPFAVSLPLTAAADSTAVETKAKYLSELRQSVTSLQDRINRELTARMEEDKAREASAAAATGGKVVDDEKEEENYGEEVQEEEED
ncbi:Gon7 family-domain-containing protein [Parachaetomium inaequale]|uniref:EKC/KEOPS complex subunit GON7 n=1 Tax=Parachaetomium inaequale TaxID=2588326 RepID=A0AAN6PG99_9PEZI|nr:Gon7 family-domain-containing protein [Parachaetomium inaequale]